MKRLLAAFCIMLPTVASAAPRVDLPLRYSYGDRPTGDVCFVDKTGINYVDGSCVAQSRQKGPIFKLLCFDPTHEDGWWETVTIKEDLRAGTLTYTFKGEKPETLQRCD